MKKIRILVVDEEPQITHLIKMLLKKSMSDADVDITECHSVVKATEIIVLCGSLDMIITDHDFFRGTGKEIVETAKVICGMTKVIMYSATLSQHIIDKGGADEYMQKPFSIDKLITTIRQLTPTHKLGLAPQAYSNC